MMFLVKISYNALIFRRIAKIKDIVEFDTQKIRVDLIRNLQELFILAKKQAENKNLQLPQRQKWVRVAAYDAQVVNSLTKTFDEAQLTKDLKQLEALINEAVATQENRGTQKPSSSVNSSSEKQDS